MSFAEAIESGDLNAFRAALDADIDEDDEWLVHEALWDAALTPGRVDFVRLLAERTDVNSVHEDGDTLLMKCVASGDVNVVSALLDLGADPCATNEASRLLGRGGQSVLHVAKSAAMLELLLTRGARAVIDAQTTDARFSALHVHARENRVDCVSTLLRHGADRRLLSRERRRIDDRANFDARGVCADPFEVTGPGHRAIEMAVSNEMRAALE